MVSLILVYKFWLPHAVTFAFTFEDFDLWEINSVVLWLVYRFKTLLYTSKFWFENCIQTVTYRFQLLTKVSSISMQCDGKKRNALGNHRKPQKARALLRCIANNILAFAFALVFILLSLKERRNVSSKQLNFNSWKRNSSKPPSVRHF